MFKTTPARTPEEYIAKLAEPRRTEIARVHAMIREAAPSLEPWIVSGMIGYGRYRYRGRTGDSEWFIFGLASHKSYISLYSMAQGPGGRYLAESYTERLPKASIGKSCVRFKRLEDVDLRTLRSLVTEGAGRGAPDIAKVREAVSAERAPVKPR